MAISISMLLDTLPAHQALAVGDDVARIAALLGADETTRAIAAGTGRSGIPLLLVATQRRVLTIDESIPLHEVTSVATSGGSATGVTIAVHGEMRSIQASGIPFAQAQRFVAAVRAGVARAEVTTPWLPTQRLAE